MTREETGTLHFCPRTGCSFFIPDGSTCRECVWAHACPKVDYPVNVPRGETCQRCGKGES